MSGDFLPLPWSEQSDYCPSFSASSYSAYPYSSLHDRHAGRRDPYAELDILHSSALNSGTVSPTPRWLRTQLRSIGFADVRSSGPALKQRKVTTDA